MKWYLWIANSPLRQNGFEEAPPSEESLTGLIIVALVGGAFISYVLAASVPSEFWHAAFWGGLSLSGAVAAWWWHRAAVWVDSSKTFVEVTDDTITVSQNGQVSTLLCKDVYFIRARAKEPAMIVVTTYIRNARMLFTWTGARKSIFLPS